MQFSHRTHNGRVAVLLVTSLSLVVGGALVAPDADAHGWRHHHGWITGDSDSSAPASSTSYYPGTPLGPIGSAVEDAKCDVDDLCTGEDRDHDGRYDYIKDDRRITDDATTSTSTTTTVSKPKPVATAPTVKVPTTKPVGTSAPAASLGITEKAYLTGYSWEDNTPRGSREISHPVIHKQAAGKGTFEDPITLAVGHSINPTAMKFPAGTKFYVPLVRAYFIVEDTCGDGSKPQNGGCWTGYPSDAKYWIDLYVGSDPTDKCMNAITGVHTVVRNPDSGYVAVARKGDAGSTYYGIGSACTTYGDTPVRK